MDQKHWEDRLDRAADHVSRAVSDGVHVLEDAYEKGKQTLKEEFDTRGNTGATNADSAQSGAESSAAPATKPARGSPRLGLILVGLGLVWLLNALGILNQPVFPILLIALGIYFVARSR
ncbi:MAG TPA: hypothetical protein VFH88_02460 [Candidatus Krumholzibacteria bacterium]|nr:hypothetical protein [Candidatus Krumholzibacteria bacterium]